MAQTIDGINNRLAEILKQVDDPDLPMEEILNLYEEAVRLGTEAGSMVEANISDADALAALNGEGAGGEAADADADVDADADADADAGADVEAAATPEAKE